VILGSLLPSGRDRTTGGSENAGVTSQFEPRGPATRMHSTAGNRSGAARPHVGRLIMLGLSMVIIGVLTGWLIVDRGGGDATSDSPPATDTPAPSTSAPSSLPPATPSSTTPDPNDGADGPSGIGTTITTRHFSVAVLDDRDHSDRYEIRAEVCVHELPEAGDEEVTLSTAAWSVIADGTQIPADPHQGSYDTVSLPVGGCNEGWIRFDTEGEDVSRILYRNDFGETASW
jgi:hypothetical protein